VNTTGSFEDLTRALGELGELLPKLADQEMERTGLAVLARVKLNASGRPGPRRVTGDYTRSMNLQAAHAASGRVTVTVGTNAVQGPRLEFGFHGTDSLGRRYNQPPFPHWRPAFEWAQSAVAAKVPDIIDEALRRSFG
jgi:hypothetical protein